MSDNAHASAMNRERADPNFSTNELSEQALSEQALSEQALSE
jgi:hypothetical protein